METRNKNFSLHSVTRTAERERGYSYLPAEKSTSNGSGFQFVKNGDSVASFLQRSFVLKKRSKNINQLKG
jgi:hypothetical protein